jgi:cysteine desulfurase
MKTIYFDHAATTPLDERVLEAMMPYLKNEFGNANSAHHLGQHAKVAVEKAREKVAQILNAEPSEIIFTSGGTESDNAAIRGSLTIRKGKTEIISSELEHHAVLHPVEFSKLSGHKPVYVKPDSEGHIQVDSFAELISEETAMATLMHVNNEIGVVNPIKEMAEACREKGVPFHTDAVQSVGKIPVDVKELGVDLLSASGHKIYGPKGIGLLYVRSGAVWMPWMQGGSQERRRRGGTLNVPGIVGFAKALEISISEMEENTRKYKDLQQHLLTKLHKVFGEKARLNGSREAAVAHINNISFLAEDGRGVDGEMLILNLDIEGICVSNGSACTSGAMEPSHVLTGIGLEEKQANSSIRISFGKSNTIEDVDYLVAKLEVILNRMFAVA